MEVNDVVKLFTGETPVNTEIKNTSHGDGDFRETFIVDLGQKKIVTEHKNTAQKPENCEF